MKTLEKSNFLTSSNGNKQTQVDESNQQKLNKKILSKLNETVVVGIDTEFISPVDYDSHKRQNISIVQLHIDSTYILDVMSCPQLITLVKKVCESDKLKVGHDLCEDFVQFRHQNVNCHNFFDTQVAFRLYSEKQQKQNRRECSNLSLKHVTQRLLQVQLDLKDGVKNDFVALKKMGLGVFAQRPLPNELLQQAAEDVVYLPHLQNWFRSNCKELMDETLAQTESTCIVYSNLNTHAQLDFLGKLDTLSEVARLAAHGGIPIRGMVKNVSFAYSQKLSVLYLGLNLGLTGICVNLFDNPVIANIAIGHTLEFILDLNLYQNCITTNSSEFVFLKFSDAQEKEFIEKDGVQHSLEQTKDIISFIQQKWNKENSSQDDFVQNQVEQINYNPDYQYVDNNPINNQQDQQYQQQGQYDYNQNNNLSYPVQYNDYLNQYNQNYTQENNGQNGYNNNYQQQKRQNENEYLKSKNGSGNRAYPTNEGKMSWRNQINHTESTQQGGSELNLLGNVLDELYDKNGYK